MNFYPFVTEQDLIFPVRLAEQQKNQRSIKIKNKISKQRLDKKLAESFPPILNKLEEVDKGSKKIGEVLEKTPQTATKNITPTE